MKSQFFLALWLLFQIGISVDSVSALITVGYLQICNGFQLSRTKAVKRDLNICSKLEQIDVIRRLNHLDQIDSSISTLWTGLLLIEDASG